jgi:DNA polymerase-1
MFEEKGYTQVTALANARLARILTVDDYDFDKKEPKLWTPSSDYRIDDGAGSTAKKTRTKSK